MLTMKTISILVLAMLLEGCLPLMVASGVSTVTTGKGIAEHGLSLATGADCSGLKTIVDYEHHSYYCEQPREPGTTYNRNVF